MCGRTGWLKKLALAAKFGFVEPTSIDAIFPPVRESMALKEADAMMLKSAEDPENIDGLELSFGENEDETADPVATAATDD